MHAHNETLLFFSFYIFLIFAFHYFVYRVNLWGICLSGTHKHAHTHYTWIYIYIYVDVYYMLRIIYGHCMGEHLSLSSSEMQFFFFLVFHTQQNIEWIDLPLFVLHKYKFNWFGNTFYDVWFWLRDYKFVNWTIKNRIWSTINTAQRTHWVAVIQWKLTQEIPLINFFLTVSCFFSAAAWRLWLA